MKQYRTILVLLTVLAVLGGGYWLATRSGDSGEAVGIGVGDSSGNEVVNNGDNRSLDANTGGSGAVSDGSGTDSEKTAEELLQLVMLAPQELVQLNVEFDSEVFTLVRAIPGKSSPEGGTAGDSAAGGAATNTPTAAPDLSEAVWTLKNRMDFTASESTLDSIARTFCSLRASKLVHANAEDLTVYGLGTDNTAKLTAVSTEGVETAIEIGDQNPTKDGYYVRKITDKDVYLCDKYAAERLRITKEAVVDLTVFRYDEADLQRISMERGGEPVFTAIRADDVTWNLTAPVSRQMYADVYGQISAVFTGLTALKCEAADVTDLSEYGLDTPRYQLRVEVSGDASRPNRTQTLLLGSEKDKGSSIYALLDETHDVFSISLSGLPFLDKPIKEMLDPFIYIVNIADVNTLSAVFDGQIVRCDIQTADKSQAQTQMQDQTQTDRQTQAEEQVLAHDEFIVNGLSLSSLDNPNADSLFRKFYQGIIGITLYGVEPDAEPSGDPEVTFIYQLKTAPADVLVEFVSKDERLYYALINSRYTGVVVEKRKLDEDGGLRQTWQALREIMAAPPSESA